MITRLKISNFKSIGDPGVALELRPLTILLGPNGSGKSSILEAPCVLAQSRGQAIEGSIQREALVSYPSIESIAHRGELGNWLVIEIHIKLSAHELDELSQIRKRINTGRLHISIDLKNSIGYKYEHRIDTRETCQSIMVGDEQVVKVGFVRTDESSFQSRFILPTVLKDTIATHSAEVVLVPQIFQQQKVPVQETEALTQFAELAVKIIAPRILGKLFLISALRGEVGHRAKTRAEPEWVGKHGEQLVETLAFIFGKREHHRVAKKVGEWAQRFGISNLSAGWWGGDNLGADYEDPVLRKALGLAFAGHGSRQVMSIVTQLFWGKPDDVLLIEEPEISLHPDAQAALPELFADGIREGKQVILTSHSEVVPLALRRPIEKKLLKSNDIAIYHVEKTDKGTQATRLELSKDGYVRGWIPSFAETESELLRDWVRTIPKE